MNRLLAFILCVLCFSAQAWTKRVDSLFAIYNNPKEVDTSRLYAIHSIAWSYNHTNPDSCILLAEKELELAKSSGEEKFEGRAFNTIGYAYLNKGLYPKALEYLLNACKIAEKLKDKRGLSNSCINLGIVYMNQLNYSEALKYYFKCKDIDEERGNKKGVADCYNNIGNAYSLQLEFSKALEFYGKSLAIQEEIGNKPGIGTSLTNIGFVYDNTGDHQKALQYFLRSLGINRDLDFKGGLGTCYLNISENYNYIGDQRTALLYCDSANIISREISDLDLERKSYQAKATISAAMGNYKQAYENHVKFKRLTDSIFNSENSKQMSDLKTNFEVEKKEAELKIKAEAQQAIDAEEKQKQKVIIYATVSILLLVLVFSFFLFNRFRITQKQKRVIEEQKILVDSAYQKLHERNREVIDSINYASRIQRALIPTEKYIIAQLDRLKRKSK